MSGDVHVRFCEGVGVRLPRATHLLIGMIGSKQEAEDILKTVQLYLRDELKLEISQDKSGIHLAQDGITYLGYGIKVRHSTKRVRMTINTSGGKRHILKRTLNADIDLYIPEEKVIRFCHRNRYGNLVNGTTQDIPILTHRSDAEIISHYNAQLRGLANFYSLAGSAKTRLAKLQWIWQRSLLKTLARKHRTTVTKTATTLRHGCDYGIWVNRGTQRSFLKVYSLRTLSKPNMDAKVDVEPNVALFMFSRSEMMDRINKNKCEYCGREDGYTESHHVRKLKDVTNEPGWKRVMISMQRKVIILCRECHEALHKGTLPSWMRNARSNGEPDAAKVARPVRRGFDA